MWAVDADDVRRFSIGRESPYRGTTDLALVLEYILESWRDQFSLYRDDAAVAGLYPLIDGWTRARALSDSPLRSEACKRLNAALKAPIYVQPVGYERDAFSSQPFSCSRSPANAARNSASAASLRLTNLARPKNASRSSSHATRVSFVASDFRRRANSHITV